MSEGRDHLKESIGEGLSNRVTFEQRPGWRRVANSKDIQGTAGSRPQTRACIQHVPGGRCGLNKVMERGGTREETEARVKEGHTVGTSQSTLSDSPGNLLFLYLVNPATVNVCGVLVLCPCHMDGHLSCGSNEQNGL